MVEIDSKRGDITALEKKQKKFDQQLAEKNQLVEKISAEKDSVEARARQAETKSLSLTRELEELQDRLDESDRLRKQLQVCQFRIHSSYFQVYLCLPLPSLLLLLLLL